MRASNQVVGLINLMTFLLSVPIFGGGIWLSMRANNTDCMKFLQWPLIIIGFIIMFISLAGLVGACYRNTLVMKLYLVIMFFIIVVHIGFIIFAFVVTDNGSGRVVQNRAYLEYYLEDYSGWLEERVATDTYWKKISSCIRDSKVCSMLGRTIGGVPETAYMFYFRKLNPIESGCCKPPTECGYIYQNETLWNTEVTLGSKVNPDCSRWSNDQQLLCYECDSCKAGVLSSLKKSWRKVSVIDIVVEIVLVNVSVVGYVAYKNILRIHNCEPCGRTTMTKMLPP